MCLKWHIQTWRGVWCHHDTFLIFLWVFCFPFVIPAGKSIAAHLFYLFIYIFFIVMIEVVIIYIETPLFASSIICTLRHSISSSNRPFQTSFCYLLHTCQLFLFWRNSSSFRSKKENDFIMCSCFCSNLCIVMYRKFRNVPLFKFFSLICSSFWNLKVGKYAY